MPGLTPDAGGPAARDGAADAYSRRVQLLQGTGHFGGVSHDVLAQVATMLKPLAVPADGIVVHEGEPGDQLFLVETGTLAVTTDIDGRPRELALLGPGQFFGETALLEQAGRAATVRATTNAQLWALSAEDFQQLRARHPEIETVARRATAQRGATRTGVFEVEQRAIAPGPKTARIRIGRNPDNEMVYPSELVSGYHAEIELLGDVARLRDLDSTNGTFVNDVQVSTADLNDGDEVRVGDERFTFDRRAIQASLAPQAPAPAQAQIRIGRASDNDIVFDSRLISSHHAVIESADGGYRLRDLDSLNGTFVNGARIRSATLNDGDEIWVGDERFIFDRRAIHHTAEPHGIRIDATGLTREVRGGKRLLNDISMSIVPGEFVAIVGGSGAGKTTLMDAMSGVQPATSGRLLYNGREYYRNLGFFRNVLGYVPQDDIIHTGLPVRVTLRHAARLRLPPDTSPEELDHAVDKALAELELTQQADLKVGLLSGGQRKRASIGVELLTEPRVFFLDEPTSGLDPFTDAQLMGLLRRLADSGSTVILTTHATMNVMLCDKVVFLARGGHLAFFGTPQRALEYFEADSFNTIYERLAEQATPEEWSKRFRDSADYQQVVSDQLSPAEADADGGGGAHGSLADSGPSGGLGRALRQFRVLSRRSLDLFIHNPSTLPSLVLPPLIFSALALALFGSNVFGSHENSAAALQIVFLITFSAFIFGLLFAVQEIVKEFPIFRRERLVNLGVVPYVLSKTAVLAPLLVLLLIVMVGIMRVTGRLPDAGFGLYGKLLLTLVLTAFVGLALALFTSALVSNSQQATDMLSVWIMPQVLFGGALVAVPLMNLVGKIISAVAPVRWSFEAVGQIVDLDTQFNVDTSRIGPGLAIQYTGSFTRDPVQNWIILALFIVVPIALTCVILKRKTTAR